MGFLYSHLIYTPPLPTTLFTSRTIIIIGASSGLGLEAARHFIRLDAQKVVLAVRDLKSGEEAKTDIEASTGRRGVVEVWELDLARYDSIKAFGSRATTDLERLDVLLLNASVAATAFKMAEGLEESLTVNVTGTFLLMLLLLPSLAKTGAKLERDDWKPVVSVVTSNIHSWTTLNANDFPEGTRILERLSDARKADMGKRYPLTKLLQVLLVREIAPLLSRSHPGVTLNMLSPGLCKSRLTRSLTFTSSPTQWLFSKLLYGLFARSTEVGSRTLVAAATAGEESHGKYLDDGKVEEQSVSEWAKGGQGALMGSRLWNEVREVCEDVMPGVTEVAR